MPPAPPIYPPAGYTAYQGVAGGPTRSTAGARKATIVLFWCASAAAFLLGLVAYQRGTTVDKVDLTLKDLDDANARLGGAFLLLIALQIAAAILLAVWSSRTVSNAKARGADASPGLAAGGWFIPIGNYWVPWGQIRKAAARFGAVPSALTTWQVLFLAQAVLGVIARVMVGGEINVTDTDAVSKLHNQGFLYLASGVALVAGTLVATKAMKEVDKLTTPS